MRQLISSLDVIDVAAPCPADWHAMTGDDRVRHCGQCQLNVYNLSDMTADEAMSLVNKSEGRMCVRFFRRQDGTMITRDCPVGLAALRQRVVRMWAKAAALAGTFFVGGLFGRWGGADEIAEPRIPPAVLKAIEVDVHLHEAIGQICILPVVPHEELIRTKLPTMKPEQLKALLGQCLQKELEASFGMPDPDDKSRMPEHVRQSLQEKVDDASFLPQPGSKEHKEIVKVLSGLLKKHTGIAQQLMPQPDIRPAMLGKVIVRP